MPKASSGTLPDARSRAQPGGYALRDVIHRYKSRRVRSTAARGEAFASRTRELFENCQDGMDNSNHARALMIPLLLLALALRLAPWDQNRFLEDEALYAYWGLQIATGTDPMLNEEPVDKPPLHPYTLALSFLLLGQSETAARLPSLFASMLSVALAYALGQALFYDAQAGLLAAFLLALSPFDILFASTAFTDPLLTACVLAALLAAAAGQRGWAGVLAGLAATTKQQGLFFLPLVVAVAILAGRAKVSNLRTATWSWLCFALGFALVVGGALGWDAVRAQRPGVFEQSLISYGGLGPAQSQALGLRAKEWLRLIGSFWASPWFGGLLAAGLGGWVVGGLVQRRLRPSRLDLTLAAFCICFLGLHWLVGFQVWDRYLLGLLPLVALLPARAFAMLGRAVGSKSWQCIYAIGLGLVVIASLAGPVLQATRSELPLGGDHGAYDGIDALATYVHAHAPAGSVLYHYWLGYHYRFYLYGAPLRLHWYPDLADLTRDATVYRREPRYIAFPSWRDSAPADAALDEAGIHLALAFETVRRDGTTSLRLYRLEGP
jgi:hypothetical protein